MPTITYNIIICVLNKRTRCIVRVTIYIFYTTYMYTQHTRTYCNRARRSPSSYKASHTPPLLFVHVHTSVCIYYSCIQGVGHGVFQCARVYSYNIPHDNYIAYPVHTIRVNELCVETSAAENRQNAVVHSIYNMHNDIILYLYIGTS